MTILKEIEHKKKKKIKYYIFFVIFLSIIGYIIYNSFLKKHELDFKIYTVGTGNIVNSLNNDGKIYYKEQYNINFPISGTLSKIYKNEGELVKKGDWIASLDNTYLKINVDKAQIALNTALANLEAKKATKNISGDLKIGESQVEANKTILEGIIKTNELELENASKNLEIAKNDYDFVKNLTQKDIDNANSTLEIAQKNYDNGLSTLDLIKNQEQEKLVNLQEKGFLQIENSIPLLEKYLKDTDVLLGITDKNKALNDSFEVYLGAKNTGLKISAENSFREASNLYEDYIKNRSEFNKTNYSLAINKLQEINDIENSVNTMLNLTLDVLKNSISSTNFSQETINLYISSFELNIINLNSSISLITQSKQAIQEQETLLNYKIENQNKEIESLNLQLELAKNNFDKINLNIENTIQDTKFKLDLAINQYNNTKTKTDNNIAQAKSQINISEASLDYKKDLPSEKELAPFYKAIENSKKGLEEANKRIEDSILKSPINGHIGKLYINKIGSQINSQSVNPFLIIINKDKLYIETNIEENDIPNIKLGQKINISFDSLDNVKIKGVVTYISDKSMTDENDIVSYKVNVDLLENNSQIKEGFTTGLDFIIEEKDNVILVPIEAVKEEKNIKSVILKDGTSVNIETGIADGNFYEVTKGLKIGDEIRY
ncbi:HlyD family efflux transporter periplasmic adaptor subunit [Candidatus Gracilibacteria bacterium]|nr:HlyD family efflux transporter periplasmic adaptor subunit [Candidatus Gracilibacteria bacterium]